MKKHGMSKLLLVLLTLVLLSSSILAGCSSQPSQTATETTIFGWVSASEPVSGAKLAVYDIKGKLLTQSVTDTTGDLGSFIIKVKELPSEFRIVASGGEAAGVPINSDMSADFRGFDPATDTVYINVLTTVVSAYMKKNPGKTLAESTASVKKYLEIPQGVDIGRGLTDSQSYFSEDIFMEEAGHVDGFKNMVNRIVVNIGDGTSGNTRAFVAAPTTNSNQMLGAPKMLGGMDWVAEKLASGAVGYVGGELFGWGLSSLGLGFPDKTAEQLNEIKNMLVQMQAQMNRMEAELTQLSQDMNALQAQMQQLSSEIKVAEYDIRISQMTTLVTNIISIKDKMAAFVTNPPSDLAVMRHTRNEIMGLIEKQLIGNEDIINAQMVGFASTTPLLKLWSQVIKSEHRFLNSADSAKVQTQFDYFDKLQLWMTEMLVEYYHCKALENPDGSAMYKMWTGKAADIVQKYKTNYNNQKQFQLAKIPDGLIWDKQLNYLMQPKPYYVTYPGAKYVETLRNSGIPLPYDIALGIRTFYQWFPLSESELNSVFNTKGGGNLPKNAYDAGWPAGTLNSSMNVGMWPLPDNKVFSLNDGSTHTVQDAELVNFIYRVQPVIYDWTVRPPKATSIIYFW